MAVVTSKSNTQVQKDINLELIDIKGHPFLKMSNCDQIRPFFMSVVSDSDHWMFISSNGGLSAGRKNAEFAIFPYYTDDKITEFADITGSKTLLQIEKEGAIHVWEPFSIRLPHSFRITRNLYKSIYGNIISFEEVNHDLNLTFRYTWSSSNSYGFVKESEITNLSSDPIDIRILDGIQNIMPAGVGSDLQRASSNLVDAYKRSELHEPSKLGIFALSAKIVDKAEPSEALRANVAWSIGLHHSETLLSSQQLNDFRLKKEVHGELDVKGEKGAYFVKKSITLESKSTQSWKIITNVNLNHSQIALLCKEIQENKEIETKLEDDIQLGTKNLIHLVASSDGLQHTQDTLQDCRHFSNVLFNIMRGGIFDSNYKISKVDFSKYLLKANSVVFSKQEAFINNLDSEFDYDQLKEKVTQVNDPDLIRLSLEYLPLKFSRRHGDPSRPWNKFSINIRDEKDGSKILDYEGNWRDIFQNWEALAYSYPEFIDGMIFKFLNASTFDGYNPYRVTKDGFDWEVIEPDDPWSYIGYWGDHQIIYLQKFLEIIEKFYPDKLQSYLAEDWFVYAAVPYQIKPYSEIVANPKDTIDFDHKWDEGIRKERKKIGADGALWKDSHEEIYHVNLVEKLLATLLAKLSNFIPEGGIWMNTQRPEWNDANNALVGNGVSMVTLYYLRRCLAHLAKVIDSSDVEQFKISGEIIEFYHNTRGVFEEFEPLLQGEISSAQKKQILDRLGEAASEYRAYIYQKGFWGNKRSISRAGLSRFLSLSLKFMEHSIEQNQRADNLYHAYNLMTYSSEGITITHLDEMLEGQVAVLSSGYLKPEGSLEVLEAMKASALFRPDQYSYILYPNKMLPGFLEKNNIDPGEVSSLTLIKHLVSDNNKDILEVDIHGKYHFNGDFKNASDIESALSDLPEKYQQFVIQDKQALLEVFEQAFNHKAFTGRSGTFYAFEGLGSIYWHMVSKLLLATQEAAINAMQEQAPNDIIGRLLDHYYEIQAGIGVHKSPDLYGAFPTDPYSHTPMHRGAQQPGMTGQVKEDVLANWSEKGIIIQYGQIHFKPNLLRKSEFSKQAKDISFVDLEGKLKNLTIQENQLFFSYCQVPIVYHLSEKNHIKIEHSDGSKAQIEGFVISEIISRDIFQRKGSISAIHVYIDASQLK